MASDQATGNIKHVNRFDEKLIVANGYGIISRIRIYGESVVVKSVNA